MANLTEIMQLCRLCLVKDKVNTPIFEGQGDIRQVFLKISACLPVKISREDKLPKKICDECSYKLELLYQFWNTSANSEKQLLKWLNQLGNEKVSVVPTQSHSINADGVVLKQEVIELADGQTVDELTSDDLNVPNDTHEYILQQQQLPYQTVAGFQFQQDGFGEDEEEEEATENIAGPSATITNSEALAETAVPRRKRRAAAMKALPPNLDSEEEDDVDMVETKIAKTEEQSDDESGCEDPVSTAFVGLPSDNADDNEQPGPSGVGKGTMEAPSSCPEDGENSILRRLIIGPSMTVRVQSNPYLNLRPKTRNRKEHEEKTKNGLCIDDDDDNDEEKIDCNDTQNLLKVKKTTTRKRHAQYKRKTRKRNPPLKMKIKLEGNDPVLVNSDTSPEKTIKDEKTTSIKGGKLKKKGKSKPNERVHCDICDTTFKNNISFALHSIVHNNNERYSCHMCPYTSTSKYHFEMHVRAHEGSTRYKCEVCNKAFTVSTHAIEHKYFHTGEKPFQCEICGKHFMFSWFLTSHRRTQHWEIMTGMPLVKYDCTICKKHYTSSTGLKRHKLSQHNEEGIDMSVLCDICGKRLASKEKLKFHRRTHTGYKPYGCNVCSKSFSRKEQLKEHERVHTGEKPFICKYCGKGFTQRSPLKIHERTHTGERPYVCRLCNKGFISKGVMDTHMKNCDGVPFATN